MKYRVTQEREITIDTQTPQDALMEASYILDQSGMIESLKERIKWLEDENSSLYNNLSKMEAKMNEMDQTKLENSEEMPKVAAMSPYPSPQQAYEAPKIKINSIFVQED